MEKVIKKEHHRQQIHSLTRKSCYLLKPIMQIFKWLFLKKDYNTSANIYGSTQENKWLFVINKRRNQKYFSRLWNRTSKILMYYIFVQNIIFNRKTAKYMVLAIPAKAANNFLHLSWRKSYLATWFLLFSFKGLVFICLNYTFSCMFFQSCLRPTNLFLPKCLFFLFLVLKTDLHKTNNNFQ